MKSVLLKFFFFLLLLFLSFYINITPAFSNDLNLKFKVNSPKYFYNGVEKIIEPGKYIIPTIEKQTRRVIIPLEFIATQLELDYLKQDNSYIITKGKKSMKITIYDSTAYIDDYKVSVFPNPIYINGKPHIPLRFIAENFGFDVFWNQKDKSIEIKNNKSLKTVVNSRTITYEDEDSNIFYDVDIPVITGTEDVQFQKNINDEILNIYSNKIQKFLNSSEESNITYSTYTIYNDITYCSKDIISIMIVENEQWRVERSPIYKDDISSISIDFDNKKILILDDLFNEIDYLLDLKEIISNIHENELIEYEPLINNLSAEESKESFNITPDGIMLYNFETFTLNYDDKYEYIIIPYNYLSHILKNKYLLSKT